MLELSEPNYYSPEANAEYMSSSQFKAFQKCEAAALAEVRGEYTRDSSQALLLGTFVDALLTGSPDQVIEEHPEIFTKYGKMRAEFATALIASERAMCDPMFAQFISGEHQKILTGEIGGVPFKAKMDSYHPGRCIVDLKYMKDFEPIWVNGQKMNFAYAWGYDIQGAIYQCLEGNRLPFFIAGITKQDPADFGVFAINQRRMDIALNEVKSLAPRYAAIKRGEIEPYRCEKCAYCRATRKLTEIYDVEEI